MKQLTAVTAFAFVLSAGLSVGIFAGIQSTSTPSSDSCSLNKKKDSSNNVAFQAKDGKKCDKKDCDCKRKKKGNTSKTVNKKECDHKKKKGNTSRTSSKKECDLKKKQQTNSKKECDAKNKKTASSGSGSGS